MKIDTQLPVIGLDIAKNVFQLHIVEQQKRKSGLDLD